MRKAFVFVCILLFLAPLVAQEGQAPAKEWKLLGSQSREYQRLLSAYTQAMTNLQAAISEYKTELRLVYKDMPENVEFNLEKAVFQVPPQPPVKEKKDDGPTDKQREKKVG